MIKNLLNESSSQAHQDVFAYYICNTDNGYFLDLGSAWPCIANNTYLLEKKGWNGLCFDITNYSQDYLNYRKSPFIQCDLNVNGIEHYLKFINAPKVIDYLSLDIDDSTEEFLDNNYPDEYEFKCITIEHDLYRIGDRLKNKSKEFFLERGYTLLCENVALTNSTNHDVFEDWYINEKYIDIDRVKYLKTFDLHHNQIMGLISENEKKVKRKILVFSHNYIYGDWEIILREQLQKLYESKLYENAFRIFYYVYSSDEDGYNKFVKILSDYKKIEIMRHNINDDEFQTLICLQEFIKNSSDDYNILYYHMKGVSSKYYHELENIDENAVISWRHLLEYFNITKWEKCVNILNYYDTTGALYIDESGQFYQHYYCGNFWWTKSDYIKKLPDIREVRKRNKITPLNTNPWWTERIICELWIGMIPHSWISSYSTNITNIYNTYFNPQDYIEK